MTRLGVFGGPKDRGTFPTSGSSEHFAVPPVQVPDPDENPPPCVWPVGFPSVFITYKVTGVFFLAFSSMLGYTQSPINNQEY